MTKKQLQEVIHYYQIASQQVTELEEKFGIDIWQKENGIHQNTEMVIYIMSQALFGDKNDIFWDYILNESTINFDELCNELNIKE